jgi:electron transfer flavoprotein alpha subunit
MTILVVAEHPDSKIDEATMRTLGAAALVATFNATDVHLLISGADLVAAEEAAQIAGVTEVFVSEICSRPTSRRGQHVAALMQLAKLYSHIFAPTTPFAAELAQKIARWIGIPIVKNVTAIQSENTFERRHCILDCRDAVIPFKAKNVMLIAHGEFNPVSARGGSANIQRVGDPPVGRRSIFLEADSTVSLYSPRFGRGPQAPSADALRGKSASCGERRNHSELLAVANG